MGLFNLFRKRSPVSKVSEPPLPSMQESGPAKVVSLQNNNASDLSRRTSGNAFAEEPATKIFTKEEKLTYHQYGAQCAIDTQSNAEVLSTSLESVYNKFLFDTKLDEEAIQSRISKLETEVLQKKSQKERAMGEISFLEKVKESKDRKIEDLQIQKINLKESSASLTDWVPFLLGTFILIVLTLFLYAFYCSLIYSLFFGTPGGSVSFFNPNVFSDTTNKGGLASWVIFCSPIIVLSIGYLIHTFLLQRRYVHLVFLLVLLLAIDSLISYQIASSIHENKFRAGLTDEKWQVGMALNDPQFWTIILLGYVMYIIWGVLLHNALVQYGKLQPDKIMDLKLENLDKRIIEIEGSLLDTNTRITEQTSQVAILSNEIDLKENDIIGYRNGIIPVKVSALRDAVNQFMNGWYAQTNLLMTSSRSRPIIDKASKIQNEWLEHKIRALDSDH